MHIYAYHNRTILASGLTLRVENPHSHRFRRPSRRILRPRRPERHLRQHPDRLLRPTRVSFSLPARENRKKKKRKRNPPFLIVSILTVNPPATDPSPSRTRPRTKPSSRPSSGIAAAAAPATTSSSRLGGWRLCRLVSLRARSLPPTRYLPNVVEVKN